MCGSNERGGSQLTSEAEAHDHASMGVGGDLGLVVPDPCARHVRAARRHAQPCNAGSVFDIRSSAYRAVVTFYCQ